MSTEHQQGLCSSPWDLRGWVAAVLDVVRTCVCGETVLRGGQGLTLATKGSGQEATFIPSDDRSLASTKSPAPTSLKVARKSISLRLPERSQPEVFGEEHS